MKYLCVCLDNSDLFLLNASIVCYELGIEFEVQCKKCNVLFD